MAIDPRTPVFVGSGQITDTTSPPSSKRPPVEFVAEAARLALADAGAAAGPQALADALDAVAVMEFFSESSPRFALPFGRSTNPPKSVADRLGASPRLQLYSEVGGNVPQSLAAHFSELIAQGEIEAALISGGELLRSSQQATRQGLALDWNEDPGGNLQRYGDKRLGWSEIEARHDLRAAIFFYPLIENAIRGAAGHTPDEHLKEMGRLFARFAAVARDNPLSMRREGWSAERLSTVDAENRYIAFPYPRLMNSNAFVDQSAAVVMCSTALADRLGIPQAKRVYLHGCAEGADRWYVSERKELHRSPAIAAVSKAALGMAGKTIADLDAFDLYSCFPSAVRIALNETGLAEDDPRGLSVTGGLPYFGGPGNNYVTHSIAQMIQRLRTLRDAKGADAWGLVTANGSYVTKHAMGVYATAPNAGPWRRDPPKSVQAGLDALPWIEVDPQPSGEGVIETYTVGFDREKPVKSYVIGRTAAGKRFVANTPPDPALLADMVARDQLGRRGALSTADGRTTFAPG